MNAFIIANTIDRDVIVCSTFAECERKFMDIVGTSEFNADFYYIISADAKQINPQNFAELTGCEVLINDEMPCLMVYDTDNRAEYANFERFASLDDFVEAVECDAFGAEVYELHSIKRFKAVLTVKMVGY